MNPSRAASRSRRSRPPTGRSSPSSPTSPIATVPSTSGPVAEGRGERERQRQVEPGLADGQAAGEVRVHVVAGQADPGPPAEHGDQQRQPVGVDARGGPARRRRAARRDERLDLDQQRPRALEHRRDDAARRRARRGRRGTRGPGRRPRSARARPSRTRRPPRSTRSGSSSRAGGAGRRSGRPRPRARRRRGARASSGRRACRPSSRARRARPGRRRPSRAPSAAAPPRAPGRRCPAARRARRRPRSARSPRRAGPGGRRARAPRCGPTPVSATTRIRSPRRSAGQPEPGGAQPDLGRGLLAGRVQDAPSAAAIPAATWSRSVDLPIPGSPPSRTTEPGDQATAEHAVELADAHRPRGPPSAASAACESGTGTAPAGAPRPGARRGSSRTTVSTRVFHCAARAALALPAGDGGATGLADESALGAGHARYPAARGQASTGVFASVAAMIRPLPSGIESTDDRVALVVAAEQQVLRERVLDQVLDRPAQRPGAVRLVVAELDQVLLGRLRDLERSCPAP